jgi:hypothetical protein
MKPLAILRQEIFPLSTFSLPHSCIHPVLVVIIKVVSMQPITRLPPHLMEVSLPLVLKIAQLRSGVYIRTN